MSEQPILCNQCRQPTSFEVLGPVSGDEKQLTVTLRGMPVLVCPNGHRQFAHGKFAMQLLMHLTEEDEPNLPTGNEKGVLLFKHFLCADCGSELQPKEDHRHTFSIDVALADQPKFDIDLTMPVYRCSRCAKEQLHSLKEIRARTPGALVSAFRAAGIAHA